MKWITGGGLTGIASELRKAKLDQLNAENNETRITAEVTIEQLQARQAALIEGRGAWVSKVVQAAYAAPFVLYNAKVVIWDKVLGWGTTDPLGPFETNLGLIVVGFYFLTTGATHTIRQMRK